MNTGSIVKNIRELFQTTEFIPLHEPSLGVSEEEKVLDCLKSTFVSSVGKYVDLVEEQIGAITGTGKAVAVVNGTAALQVALRLAGVKTGDEVITQALTFVATANSIRYNGAEPVFVDVDKDTLGMSPVALEAWLTDHAEIRSESAYNRNTGKHIAACMPMHTFGFICRIEEIVSICEKWCIPVVEDAAEALGSKLNSNESAGSFGRVGAISFNGNKIVTAGGGGAIVSMSNQVTQKAKYLTTTAKKPHAYEYFHDELGYNFRMPNLNAALLSAQLDKLDDFIASKKRLFTSYKGIFSNNLELVEPPAKQDWNHWLLAVKTENKNQRDAFLKETNENGIMTRPIWQLMYRLPMYASCQRDGQRNAEYLEDRIVNIPSSVN